MTMFGDMEKEASNLARRIKNLPQAGRQISPRGKTSCIVCRRMIGPTGFLLYPGAPSCSQRECEMVKAAAVTELFSTPYGRALDLYTLRTFLRCLDGPSVFVEKGVLCSRAEELGRAFVRLERWQWSFSTWAAVHKPEGRMLGRAAILPPKRLDEVVRIRLKGGWTEIDPTAKLDAQTGKEMTQIYEKGPEASAVPF